jgi:Azurin
MPTPTFTFRAVALVASCLLFASLRAETIDVTIRTVREQMRFDLTEFHVPLGGRVRLHFKNEDALPHNVLICLPREMCEPAAAEDNGLEVAQAAWALGAEGPARQWIPKHPRVLVSTSMLDGDQEETIEFDAPAQPGRYPFVCTFPGHAMLMFGTMHVQAVVAGLQDLRYTIYRTGPLKSFPDFDAIRGNVLHSGALPDGLVDATPVSISDHYAIEFTAVLPIPRDGGYTFSLAADKGTQLFIDGELAIDHRTGHSARAIKSGTVPLKAGDRRITMRYWHQLGDDPEASLVWSGPGFDERALSRLNLVERKRQNDGDRLAGMHLNPTAHEAVFYRNYLADIPTGGFAVGLPGGANLSWNPATRNLSTLWAGDFLDVKSHRVSRGAGAIKPAGFDIVRLPAGPAFYQTSAPPGSSADKFLGYRLDAARYPTFHYTAAGVDVEESFTVTGDIAKNDLTLRRTLSLRARGTPPADLWLRLADDPRTVDDAHSATLAGKIRLTVTGATAEWRDHAGARTWSARIPFHHGRATLTLDYRWLATSEKAAAHAH